MAKRIGYHYTEAVFEDLNMRVSVVRRKLPVVGSVLVVLMLGLAHGVWAQDAFRDVELISGTANGGMTVPMVGSPFALTAWTPETRSTEDKCIAPYYFKDTKITGFRGSHWLSGSCALEYGSFTLMPVTGAIEVAPEDRASEFQHASEVMDPAYYSVKLDKYQEKVEMTGTTRAGLLRVTFPAGQAGSVLVEPNVKPGEGFVEVHPEKNEIVGYNPVHRYFVAIGKPAGFNGYFVARFSAPLKGFGTWCGTEVRTGSAQQRDGCKRLGAYASFAASDAPLLVKVGTSFTSLEEARKNLDAEVAGWDFEGVRQKTQAEWVARLHQIEIEGATAEQRKTFYTAVYHTALVPRITSDADGTYNGFAAEGKLHTIAGASYYDDFSMWDTFRALHPLFTIVDPKREQEMVQSLVLKGEQGGYLPIFPLFNSYTSAMVGDHVTSVIADAYAKGLTHFDVKEAYRLMLQNATKTPPATQYEVGLGRRALPSYLQYGYIPMEDLVPFAFHRREQVSRTLEYAYDDFAVSVMAAKLGTPEELAMLKKHSENWRNVVDPATKFVRGRHADGSWAEPFDPKKSQTYVTESQPWQETFFVPQNVPGLIDALGGKAGFVEKLDGLFANNLYDPGNEPSHHIAYLYDYVGEPAKTQHEVRKLLTEQYHTGPEGIPGNDDAGQMAAWYIFGAMGFYPVTPGTTGYAIGSPLFAKVTIHQANGKDFVITAKNQSAANEYIQSQKLNGKPLKGFMIQHSDITKGGTLSFEMGPSPAR